MQLNGLAGLDLAATGDSTATTDKLLDLGEMWKTYTVLNCINLVRPLSSLTRLLRAPSPHTCPPRPLLASSSLRAAARIIASPHG